jgi:hypothetical protein
MRKMILIFLLIAGTGITLSAQNRYYYLEPYTTASDASFSPTRPGKARVNFHFYGINNAARITLELISITQLEHLPNLDSILNIARNPLRQISDSLKQDAINRRVDMVTEATGPIQLRITSYANRPTAFVIRGGELNLLKTESDTLRIKFTVPTGRKVNYFEVGGTSNKRAELAPAFITIVVNNFDEIQSLPQDIMHSCITLLQQEITHGYVSKGSTSARYTAFYNLKTNKRLSPGKKKWIRYGNYRNELVPNIYGSLQFARGNFAPSMAAGLRFSNYQSSVSTMRWYLMWEPYFFFRRDVANKLITERNDFITFRFIESDADDRRKGSFEYVGNFSIGYLAYRKGEWFEKNTWKLGLPGVRSGWLQLEPEFYFNNFFRNFSPTLKLTLHYE